VKQHRFESILDECLKAVGRGESLDSVLGRHPQWADELRPLLATAQRVRRTPVASPRLVAQQAGWQRFLGQAIALRRAHQRPAFALWRPLAVAASLVFVLSLGGGATVYAASKSMPDDHLYAVKLATEEARLWFAFGENDRADVLLDQADTRLTEIGNQLEEGKHVDNNVLAAMRHRMDRAADIVDKPGAPADLVARADALSARQEELLISIQGQVSFKAAPEYGRTLAAVHDVRLALRSEPSAPSDPLVLANGVGQVIGRVEQSEGGSLTVGGVPVLVDRNTIVEGDASSIVGKVASVSIVREGESVHALTVSLQSQGDVAGEMRISGVVDEVQGDRISVGDRMVTLDKHTIKDGQLRQGSQVEIIGENAGNVFAANFIHVARPNDAETTFAYEGKVEQVNPESWTVGGLTFTVSPSTPVDAGALFMEAGARARVQASRQGSELVAQRITLLTTDETEDTVAVEGVFQERLANGHWLVGGLEVDTGLSAVQPETMGALVRAVGSRSAQDGTVVSVRSVEPLLPGGESGLVRLEGVMTRLGQDAWLVGPARVQITNDTRIDGELLSGARALVWGRPGLSDSLEAVYVDVLDTQSLFVQNSGSLNY
jgi:hypothetical protein